MNNFEGVRALGITGGRGGDIFHDVIEVASNQHIQFPFLFLFEFLSKTYPLRGSII